VARETVITGSNPVGAITDVDKLGDAEPAMRARRRERVTTVLGVLERLADGQGGEHEGRPPGVISARRICGRPFLHHSIT
jgi:hypothetical protein